MSCLPGPVIFGFGFPRVVAPPNLQNQLTLTSEDVLTIIVASGARNMPLWEWRCLKSTTREGQLAIEIRQPAFVITFENRALAQ